MSENEAIEVRKVVDKIANIKISIARIDTVLEGVVGQIKIESLVKNGKFFNENEIIITEDNNFSTDVLKATKNLYEDMLKVLYEKLEEM